MSDESFPPNPPDVPLVNPSDPSDPGDALRTVLNQLSVFQRRVGRLSQDLQRLKAALDRAFQDGIARASLFQLAASVAGDADDDVAAAERDIQRMITIRIHSAPEVMQTLHTEFPRLREPLDALYVAVQDHVKQADVQGNVTTAYRALIERIAANRPLRNQADEVTFYTLLADYLQQVKWATSVSPAVRAAWEQWIREIPVRM